MYIRKVLKIIENSFFQLICKLISNEKSGIHGYNGMRVDINIEQVHI